MFPSPWPSVFSVVRLTCLAGRVAKVEFRRNLSRRNNRRSIAVKLRIAATDVVPNFPPDRPIVMHGHRMARYLRLSGFSGFFKVKPC